MRVKFPPSLADQLSFYYLGSFLLLESHYTFFSLLNCQRIEFPAPKIVPEKLVVAGKLPDQIADSVSIHLLYCGNWQYNLAVRNSYFVPIG